MKPINHSEFIDKYGDQKIDEKDLKETLNIKAKAWMPETGEIGVDMGIETGDIGVDMRTETEILEDLKYAEYMADNAVAVKKPHETKSEWDFWYEKYKEYSDELDEVRVKTICPYCTESKPIYYDGQLQIEIKDTDLCIHCVTSDLGRVYYKLQIRYCPECGRKL